MKHTLLATTALVALTGAAAAEITISGTARIGMVTTEGAAATSGTATPAALTATDVQTATYLEGVYAAGGAASNFTGTDAYAAAAIAAAEIDELQALIAAAKVVEATALTLNGAVGATTAASQATTDLATLEALLVKAKGTAAPADTAKAKDTTVGKNRVRISFAGSGTTDGGLTYGFSARADHSNTSTGGSQYISGAFGKVSMGDLDGGDEQMVGNLSGVGSSGAGSHQEFGYQSSAHNLGYSVSMAGVSFAATTDLERGASTTETGSNSAMGLSYSGDMGGAALGVAIGTSKIGNVTEDSMSVSVSMGGLSIKAVSHSNDNGPATSDTEAAATATTGYVAGARAATNVDTDTTGLSLSYAMDAMSVTAYTRTESTSGVADKDYSGVVERRGTCSSFCNLSNRWTVIVGV